MKSTQVVLMIMALVAGLFLSRLTDEASAQPPTLELEGSCSRGDLVVYESPGKVRCVELDELRADSCDKGAFLTARQGRVRCEGPSSTTWGAEGLLPRCDRDSIVVSEGFGRWKCARSGSGRD